MKEKKPKTKDVQVDWIDRGRRVGDDLRPSHTKKPKTYRFIVEVTSPQPIKITKADLEGHLWMYQKDKLVVKTATASAIRKLGDSQT